jgi:hypothetical protein
MKVYVSRAHGGREAYHTNEDCYKLPESYMLREAGQFIERLPLCQICAGKTEERRENYEGTCPVCGEDHDCMLAQHLKHGCKAV